MSLATEMSADVAQLKVDVGVNVTLGAQTVSCVLNSQRRELEMQDAGYLSEIAVELLTVLADWTTAPSVNDKLTVAGVSYRVLAREDSANGILSTLRLAKVN